MITELKTNKKFFFRIPSTSTIIPLAEGYALVANQEKTYILNLATRTTSEFVPLSTSTPSQIITYYSYY